MRDLASCIFHIFRIPSPVTFSMFYILHVKNYYSHPFIYLIDSLFVSISSSDIVNIV